MKLLRIIVVLSVCLLFVSNSTQAGEGKWYDKINIGGGITSVLQGTSGNDSSAAGTTDELDYAYTFDLGIDVELAPRQMVYVAIESGEGEGVNDNFDTFIIPNYDPFNTHNPDVGHQDVTISQAFYEGMFGDEMLTVSIGKMDIHSLSDENNFAGDETSQFMAGILARFAGTLFAELDSYYAPGIRFLLAPVEWLELTYVAANSNNDSLTENMYHVGQVNLKPNLGGLEGNYRIYLIQDERDYTNIGSGTIDSNFVWGVSLDQLVTENVGLFFRYASQDDNLAENAISEALSGGISFMGNMWSRSDDFVGIGYGVASSNDNIVSSFSGDQSVIELFYHFQALERLSLTPDIQIHNNLPRTDNRDIVVYGVRAQLDFF